MRVIWAVPLVLLALLILWAPHHLLLTIVLAIFLIALAAAAAWGLYRLSERRSRNQWERYGRFKVRQQILAARVVMNRRARDSGVLLVSEDQWSETLDELRERVSAGQNAINSICLAVGLPREFEPAEPSRSGPRPVQPLPPTRTWGPRRWVLNGYLLPQLRSKLAENEDILAAAETAYAKAHQPATPKPIIGS
jgi:hypothetical protein